MKHLMKITALAFPVLLTACSLTPVSSRVPGYLTTPKGELLMSQEGQCWRTAEWRPALAIRQCDPEVVKARELAPPEEVVEEEKTEEVADTGEHPGIEPVQRVAPVAPPEEGGLVVQSIVAVPAGEKKDETRTEVVFAPLSLGSDTTFRFGDDRLTAEGRDAVIELAGLLKRRKVQDLKLTVVGHTDRIGTDKANMDLSRRRANTIKTALVAEGITADSIETGGMGATMPITQLADCPSDIERCELIDCLRPDRRVEIKARGKIENGTRTVPVQGVLELKLPRKPAANLSERRSEMAEMCKAG